MQTDLFGTPAQVRLLDFLADNSLHDVTMQEIQEGAGLSRRTLYPLVDRFRTTGFIPETREVRGAPLFQPNTNPPTVRVIVCLDLHRTLAAKGAPAQKVPGGRQTACRRLRD